MSDIKGKPIAAIPGKFVMSNSSNPSSHWADLRDCCSAIREVVIVLTIVSLVVVPSVVRKALERAGIRSVAGVEFDVESFAQSRDELDSALAQIDMLKNQLATAQQQVQGLAESSPAIAMSVPLTAESESSPRFSPSLGSVSRLLASMRTKADETDDSLKRCKVHTEKILEHAATQGDLTPPEELFRNQEQSAAIPTTADELQR
jgi:hypothetical protein